MVLLQELSPEVSHFPLPVWTLPWLPTCPIRTSSQPAMPASEPEPCEMGPAPSHFVVQRLHMPAALLRARTAELKAIPTCATKDRQLSQAVSHVLYAGKFNTALVNTQLRQSPPHPSLLLPAEQSVLNPHLDGHRLCSADLRSLCSCCLLAHTRVKCFPNYYYEHQVTAVNGSYQAPFNLYHPLQVVTTLINIVTIRASELSAVLISPIHSTRSPIVWKSVKKKKKSHLKILQLLSQDPSFNWTINWKTHKFLLLNIVSCRKKAYLALSFMQCIVVLIFIHLCKKSLE